MKKIFLLGLLFVSAAMLGQKTINDYQYIIVDDHFDFLKKTDQYQTSSLTKFLLNKRGFKAYLESDAIPNEIYSDRCRLLFVTVLNSKGFFTIKNSVEFKDCNGKVIHKGIEGTSKKKDYKEAYHEAIRRAFKDPTIVGYKYKPSAIKLTHKKEEIVVQKVVVSKNNVVNSKPSEARVLYAQSKPNGFQLIDTTPKVIFTILKTNTTNLFILKDKNGILYQQNSKWIAEYYENGNLVSKVLEIKF
jgi:hypothetical protein